MPLLLIDDLLVLRDGALVEADDPVIDCECCEVSCGGCATAPTTITVTIAGVANGAGCTDCAARINGTYVIDIDPGTCQGFFEDVGPDCFDYIGGPNAWRITVVINDLGDPSFEIQLFLADGDAPESFRRTAEIAGSDCCDVTAEDAPQYFAPVPDCDWTGATVTVTANC
jgi:hypothetical protein